MWKKLLFVTLCLVISGVCAGAQTPGFAEGVVVSAVFDREMDTVSPGLDKLFLDCLEMELARGGIALSDEADHDMLIRIAYKVQAEILEYSLTLTTQANGRLLYQSTSREELSFELDRILLGQARTIVSHLLEYLEEDATEAGSPSPSISGIPEPELEPELEAETGPALAEAAEPAVEQAVEQSVEQAVEQAVDQAAEPAADPVASSEAESSLVAGIPAAEGYGSLDPGSDTAGGISGFVVGTDIDLFLVAGEPGRYFRNGYSFGLLTAFRLASIPAMAIGVSMDVMYFQVHGYATQAQGLIATIGPGLRWKDEDAGRIIPGFKADVGAGLFIVAPASDDIRMKIVPSLETAMTLGIRFDTMILHANLGMRLLFEDRTFLYGFTPGFGIEL